jgi:hypothetical protein
MKAIGIDQNNHLVYEGASNYGYGLWPTPILSPATFISLTEKKYDMPKRPDQFSIIYLFREEGSDPVGRTRRGRFYRRNDQQPNQWFVQPHPALIQERRYDGLNQITKMLYTYSTFQFFSVIKKTEVRDKLVLLGHEDAYAVCSIINVESIATNEDLITLKHRPMFGVIPTLNEGLIPESRRAEIIDALNLFSNEVHQASPISIVDRARDTAAVLLGTYVECEKLGRYDLDLNDLINKIRKVDRDQRKRVTENAADIVRLFHARAKHSEKERRNLRAITEQDAELAVNCIGTILCELGWASW